MSRIRATGRRRALRRGAVLLFVLILIVVSSAAILRFAEKALSEMAGEGYYVQRERLRADAFSALETTLGVLAEFKEVEGGLYAPAQGWGTPLEFAGYQPRAGVSVAVEFHDENAKLSLARAPQEEAAFVALFTDLGFANDEVDVLTDSLLDWIDDDDNPRPEGAETSDYARAKDLPYRAANRAPRSFEELAAIQGFSDLMFTETGAPSDRFLQFQQRVSLFSDGSLNLNTAPEDVIRLTGLFSEPQLAALAQALDTVDGPRGSPGGRFYKTTNELADAAGALPQGPGARFNTRTEVLGIDVVVTEGTANYRLRAIVDLRTSSTRTNTRANPRTATGPATRNAMVGTPGQLQYPFGFLELVEDPPPSTLPPPNPTP